MRKIDYETRSIGIGIEQLGKRGFIKYSLNDLDSEWQSELLFEIGDERLYCIFFGTDKVLITVDEYEFCRANYSFATHSAQFVA